ncbi:MAG: ABC transporter permease [Steroidobacteraceae bacterium]
MLANYWAAALRNLSRNRLHAAVSIAGLAVGFLAAILVILYTDHEHSFERFLPDYTQIYRLSSASRVAGTSANASADLRGPIAPQLRLAFPQIRHVAELRNTFGSASLRRGAIEYIEPGFTWADPEVFDVLPFPVLGGDLRRALLQPDGLVLTRRMARKYFGTDLPLGQTIEVDRQRTLRVMAVIEDLPSTTHLNTEIFGSTLALPPTPPGYVYRTYLYLQLAPGASPGALRAALPAFIDRTFPGNSGHPRSQFVEFPLVPIADIHLRPAGALSMKPDGDPQMLGALVMSGLLVLLIASINFVNLMTARATRRALEVAMRKAAGASRRTVALQFLGEASLYAAMAMLLAVAMTELLLPYVNAFLGTDLKLQYLHPLQLLVIAAATLGGWYARGRVSGVYSLCLQAGSRVSGRRAGAARLRARAPGGWCYCSLRY